jgi:hypothetical protein
MIARSDHPRGHQFFPIYALLACIVLASCAGPKEGPYSASAPGRVDHSASVWSATRPATPGAEGNVTPVVIGIGPGGSIGKMNVPFVSVTLCRPGTSICQTVDHILLDTGSYGLRIIAPDVLGPELALPEVTGATGKPVAECAQLFNGFLWGSVRSADVKIAAESALSVSIQQVSDAGAAFKDIPTECGHRGANAGTVAALGANGILGIGLFKEDCGAECAKRVIAGIYFECTPTNCTGTVMPLAKQVSNPVAAFDTNNNGVVIVMPAVASGGVAKLVGSLIFGIDTQTNNTITTATVYAANDDGNFTTIYNGKSLASSFLDSGANGLFFSDPSIQACSVAVSFFCPPTPLMLSAVNASFNGVTSGQVNFTIDNKQLLDGSIRAASVGGTIGRNLNNKDFDWLITENESARDATTVRAAKVGGSPRRLSRSTAFVWGMPFFFGRTVYIAIDGASTRHGPGRYWAY